MSLAQNIGRDAPESCGVCDDTGLVDHDNGDAYACNYCAMGGRKLELFPKLRHDYAVNDITAVTRRGERITIARYAQSEQGQKDPNLDACRRMVVAARRAQKEKETPTHDRR